MDIIKINHPINVMLVIQVASLVLLIAQIVHNVIHQWLLHLIVIAQVGIITIPQHYFVKVQHIYNIECNVGCMTCDFSVCITCNVGSYNRVSTPDPSGNCPCLPGYQNVTN